MKLRSRLARRSILATAILGATLLGSSAASITWGTPTTIAGDTDVVTTGVLSYAYDLSNTTTTVNGVTFTGADSTTALGGNITLSFPTGTGKSTTTYGSASGSPWNGLSANYKNMLKGGVYNGGSAATVTLKNLTVGTNYTVQLWVNDNRASGASRTQLVDGANQMDFNSTDVAGGVGQFITGTFTADAATQAITLDGNNTVSTASSNSTPSNSVKSPKPPGGPGRSMETGTTPQAILLPVPTGERSLVLSAVPPLRIPTAAETP